MTPTARRLHWTVLVAAASVSIAGAVAAWVSSLAVSKSITLIAGESQTIDAFRLIPDSIRVVIEFDRKRGTPRPELGDFTFRRRSDRIEFSSPGDPILVRANVPGTVIDLEALPASRHSQNHVGRELTVRSNDGDPRSFSVHAVNRAAEPSLLPAGRSTVTIQVVDVGPSLVGETVKIVLLPPLSLKDSSPGYGLLWWFLFWPALALPLALYAIFVGWQSWKAMK